eukprot:COSAG02_NODE_267_length_26570_cov_7.008235_2_plen_77_part_00
MKAKSSVLPSWSVVWLQDDGHNHTVRNRADIEICDRTAPRRVAPLVSYMVLGGEHMLIQPRALAGCKATVPLSSPE